MTDPPSKCSVCQSLLDEEDLFCSNCGTKAPVAEGRLESVSDSSRWTTHNFECVGCAASMSYDAKAEALRCPFCGSVDLISKQDAKVLSAQRVVPFRITRDEAIATMRQWLGRSFWRPTNLASEANVVHIIPVYVPYWIFQAQTHTFWTADTSQTPGGARGDWYPLFGEHRGSHDGIMVGASEALSATETWEICPFNLDEGVPTETIDLDNVTVERFAIPRKYARPLARRNLEAAEAGTCSARYVPGRSRNVHVNVRIEAMSSEPALLPIWIAAYRYRNRLFRFLVNGQTGRATGTAPTSFWKIGGLVLLATVVVAGIAAVMLLASQ